MAARRRSSREAASARSACRAKCERKYATETNAEWVGSASMAAKRRFSREAASARSACRGTMCMTLRPNRQGSRGPSLGQRMTCWGRWSRKRKPQARSPAMQATIQAPIACLLAGQHRRVAAICQPANLTKQYPQQWMASSLITKQLPHLHAGQHRRVQTCQPKNE